MGNEYYTFKNSLPYQHHVKQLDNDGKEINRNTFYGVYEPSSIDVLLNDLPSSIKSYQTLSYEGSQSNVNLEVTRTDSGYYNLHNKNGWHVSLIQTDKQSGVVPEFIEKEGKWFNFIRGQKIDQVVDLTTKEFSFQGIGRASEFSVDTTRYMPIMGCTDPRAANYDPLATIDDGSCFITPPNNPTSIGGCMDPNAPNYDPDATFDNGSCQLSMPDVLGCTNPLAFNYNSDANVDDGSCIMPIYGCTDPLSTNYNPFANTDDGSCVFPGDPSGDTDDDDGGTGGGGTGGGTPITLTVQDTNDPDPPGVPPTGS